LNSKSTILCSCLRVGLAWSLVALSLPTWAEPDEAQLGKSAGYPVGARWSAMENRVGSWSALDQVPGVLGQFVRRGDAVTPLSKSL